MKLKEAFIDLTVSKCPSCGNFFVEPSWFVFDLKQDFKCGVCKKVFNTKKNAVRKFLLRLELDDKGNVLKMEKRKSKY